VQITLTAPDVGGIGNAGFPHELAFSGVGVLVQRGGQTYKGHFRRPLHLMLESPRINAGTLFVVWNGFRFVPVPRLTVHRHTAFIVFDSEAEQFFAVLRHVGRHRREHLAAAGRQRVSMEILARAFLAPAGSPLPGIGVLAPEWLQAVPQT
jgi:hypothetical protein